MYPPLLFIVLVFEAPLLFHCESFVKRVAIGSPPPFRPCVTLMFPTLDLGDGCRARVERLPLRAFSLEGSPTDQTARTAADPLCSAATISLSCLLLFPSSHQLFPQTWS